jgi:hypothetical protein
MIRRSRQLRLSATAGVAGNDTDALQTDVMRFMSIIGLCLMAVFALVQGIPVQEPGKAAVAAQSSRLREVIRSQQLQLEKLQDGLRAMHDITSQAERRFAHVKAQSELHESEVRRLRAEQEPLAARLQEIKEALVLARQSLEKVREHSNQQAEQLADLEERLKESQLRLDESREEVTRLQHDTKANQGSRQPERKPTDENPPVVPPGEPSPLVVKTRKERPSEQLKRKPGFSLQFASDAALDRLIASGEVSLYAMTDRQTWRSSLRGSKTIMVPAEKPRWFHEMAVRTVPLHYLQGLDAVQGDSDEVVTWGVQLPQETRDAIRTRMQGRQGGELVIHANGTVTVKG